jgi:hypothetical protein
MIDDIKVCETPIVGEENGADGANKAQEQSEQLSWHVAEHVGITHDCRDSLKHGET